MDLVKEGRNQEPESVPCGRVCSRAGCGRPLVDAHGNPVFNRHFCSDDCKRVDVPDRQRLEKW